jgi:putative transposase
MVKQKSGLNRVILNQGWGMFKDFLTYKQAWRGGELILVDPKGTSQTCPSCQCKEKGNRLTQANFECVKCGFTDNADDVAAMNILARGHCVLACGENAVTQLSEARTAFVSDHKHRF